MKRYCSVCKQPLANPNSIVCDKCGNKTNPIKYFERFESDNFLSEHDKRTVDFIGWANIFGSILLFLLELFTYMQLCGNLDSLNNQWKNGYIEHTTENLEYIQSYSSFVSFTFVVLIVILVDYAFTAFIGIMILLKKSWALRYTRILYIFNAIFNVISLNIPGFIITIILASKLKKILSKMRGGEEYDNLKYEAEKKKPKISVESGDWICKNCSYINSSSMSECKSCGKWK